MPVITYSDIRLLILPDAQHEKPFRAYSGYFQDLAGLIAGRHGFADTLVEGVYRSAEQLPALRAVERRRLSGSQGDLLEQALRKAWGNVRRVEREVADFEEESNAWLPVQAYYAIYDALLAVAVASGQKIPSSHRQALNLASKEMSRGVVPFPWSVTCSGCPQIGSQVFSDLTDPERVHVLSAPDPDSAEDRLAMLLRTTRQKELERRFDQQRTRDVQPGRSRRNLSTAEKRALAENLVPTTLADFFYRTRLKASYEEADVFVLGAAGPDDARAFADSVSLVCDATVAALEAVVGAYVGAEFMAHAAEAYLERLRGRRRAVRRRAEAWQRRASGVFVPVSG